MPTDKQNVEFLYSIIKQLEVKHIKWPIIASENGIPNGHAARMRFHRLRQAQEGTSTRPRTVAKAIGERSMISRRLVKRAKVKRRLAELEDESEDDNEDDVPLRRRRAKGHESFDEYTPRRTERWKMEKDVKSERHEGVQVKAEEGEVRVKDEYPNARAKAEPVDEGSSVVNGCKEEPRDELEMLLDAANVLVTEEEPVTIEKKSC